MLTEEKRQMLTDSWRLVVPIADTAADLFYRRLFELRPQYRSLFEDDMSVQKRKLVTMLSFVVKSLNWPLSEWQEDIPTDEDLFLVVLALGRRHRELYKVPDEAYEPVGVALLWALDYGLGEVFTKEVRESWEEAYSLLATTMQMGKTSLEKTQEIAAHSDLDSKIASWMKEKETGLEN